MVIFLTISNDNCPFKKTSSSLAKSLIRCLTVCVGTIIIFLLKKIENSWIHPWCAITSGIPMLPFTSESLVRSTYEMCLACNSCKHKHWALHTSFFTPSSLLRQCQALNYAQLQAAVSSTFISSTLMYMLYFHPIFTD